MKILSTLLFTFLFALTLFGQNITDLQKELRSTSASDKDRIMNIKYDLAELLKNRNNTQAAKYAFDSYNLARELKNEDMMALASFLDAEIHLAKNDLKKAAARFKASLKHSKSAGDDEFAIENLKQLEQLERNRNNDDLADNYQEQADALQNGDNEVAQPRQTNPQPIPSSPNRSATKYSTDYVSIIRKLKVEKASLEEENNNLLNKLERIGNNEMTAAELKSELAREKSKQDQSVSIEQLTEIEQKYARAANELRRAQDKSNKIETEFKTLTDQAKNDKLLLMNAEVEAAQNKSFLFALGGLSLFVLLLASVFYNRFRVNKKAKTALQETNRQIEEERKLSDELLLNILPSPIAKELKESGKASAEKFDNVTVLFTDFKNFTKISERLSPEQLVRELDYCFRGFDFILSQYNVEKIKTIGDAYMCASGLTKTKTLPINIVKAALEMQEFLEDYKKERMVKGLPFFEARIGIHTGPVVAGVVGVKKFAYDIWGDTVNIAARMEANCEVGKVNISESTYNQIRYNFECQHRGKIDAKNKGFIDMYYVKQPVARTVTSV